MFDKVIPGINKKKHRHSETVNYPFKDSTTYEADTTIHNKLYILEDSL